MEMSLDRLYSPEVLDAWKKHFDELLACVPPKQRKALTLTIAFVEDTAMSWRKYGRPDQIMIVV